MELSYKDLKKRMVVNIADGKSLGQINNLSLKFPEGFLTGIFVPGRQENFIIRLFSKSKIFIPEKNIIKIGGDVILVNLNCGDTCSDNVTTNKAKIVPTVKPNPCNPCGILGNSNSNDNIDLGEYE